MQHRLKRLLALALTVIVGVSALAQANNVQKGVVRVKLQPTVAKAIGKAPRKAAAGNLTVNVSTLDASLKAIKTISVKPVFIPRQSQVCRRAGQIRPRPVVRDYVCSRSKRSRGSTSTH